MTLTNVTKTHTFNVSVYDDKGGSRTQLLVMTADDEIGRRVGFSAEGACFIHDGGLRWSRWQEGDLPKSERPPSRSAGLSYTVSDTGHNVELFGEDGQSEGLIRVESAGHTDEGRLLVKDFDGNKYQVRLSGKGVERI